MSINIWLDRSDQLVAGAEIYRSHRKFKWWDYTPSHSQLLLRCDGGREWTRIDVLFKAVSVMKIRDNYNGLHIRCATPEERQRIQAETPGVTYFDPETSEFDLGCRYFILDDGSGGLDYVVAQAVGWHEDHDLGEPGYFAQSCKDSTPWTQTSTGGTGGLGTPIATADELVKAVATTGTLPIENRNRYRYIYVVLGVVFGAEPHAYGSFLTRAEAEHSCMLLADRYSDGVFTIDATPVRI